MTEVEEKIQWSDWEGKGKGAFFNNCNIWLGKNGVILDDQNGLSGLPRLVYDLFWHGIYSSLRVEQVADTCYSLIKNSDEMGGLVLDILNIYDAETSVDTSGESRKKLAKLIKSVEGALSKELLQERMEIETLGEFKIVTNKSFYTKFIKIKTKLYYKQNKFNLFREESEGYAKLVAELNQSVGSLSAERALENIKSLIGCFNLDPTRVLDAMLDSFESRAEERAFFSHLISSYLPDKKLLCEVIGFKYTSCDKSSYTPASLHNLTIALIHDNIISLDEVYPWLSPDDKAIHKEVLGRVKETEGQGKKTSVVSVKEVEGGNTPPTTSIPYEKNQKLSLAEALLNAGDWASFQRLMSRLSPQYLLYEKSVALAMCRLIHYLIEPVYRKHSGLGSKIPRKEIEMKPTGATPPQVESLLSLRADVLPMLYALGPSLHYDPVLIFKVMRLATAAVSNIKDVDGVEVEKETLYYDVITLLDEVLLPTLSYLEANCCVAEAIWNIIKVYPLHYRYAIYSKWKDYTNKYQSEINKKMESKVNIKACMKRVSKENVKQVGRLIGKLSHYSPAALFDYIIIQIQMYDNLIGPVVDSLKYLNSLSYDVLGFSIIDSLRSNKKRIKHDGNSLAPWFQSMANFIAAVYKKYNVELSGLLFYTLEQLKSNKSIDLVILKEILNKMAGIEVTDELTDNQLEALGGGELLRTEAAYFVQMRNTKKSSARLKEALVKYNLAAPLAIMIAQERYHIVFSQLDEEHLKFVGKLYDECHETLLQFATFMASSGLVDSRAPLPDFHRLVTEFHLELDVAFLFTRPGIVGRVMEECGKEDGPSYMEAISAQLTPLVDTIKTLQPERTWEDLSPEFIALFWSLTLYDIRVPCDSYQREIAKLKQQLSTAQAAQRKPNFSDSYGAYPPSSSGAKPKKEIERIQNLTEKLKDEKTKHKNHVNSVLEKLKEEKDNWFVLRSQRPAKNEMITQFLQMCIFPRCMSSALDAHYCAHFIHTLHSVHAANFSTLLCYDRLFCDISYTVTSCTENEANRYGRFLCGVLENVMRWHSDKEIYDKECAYTPGFVTKFRGSNEFSEPNDNVHYENYRHVCHKWHYKITKSLINLLESKEYIQIRNAIIILIRILPHFPVISRLAQFIEKRIVKVMEEEKKTRQDLCILATSYCGQLMARIPHMMKESEFHVMVPSSQHNNQDSTTPTVAVKEEKIGEASLLPQADVPAPKPSNSQVPVNKGKKSSEEDEGERSKRNHKEEKHKKETSSLAFSDDERILEEYTEEYLPLSKDDSSKHSAKKTSSAEGKEAKRRKPEKRPTDSEGEKKVKKVRKARVSVGGGGEEEKERKERKVTKKRVRNEVGPSSDQPKRRTKESKSKVSPDHEIATTDKKRRYSKEKSPARISRDKKYSADRKVWR